MPIDTTARLIYAASETCADMLYATSFPAPDPFIWLQLDAERFIIVSPLEVGRAAKTGRSDTTVLSYAAARSRWDLPDDQPAAPGKLLPAIAKATGAWHWDVPASFPFGLAIELQKSGLVLTPVQAFFPERQRKTQTEVDAVAEGIRLAEAGLAHALQILSDASAASDGVLRWDGGALTAEKVAGEINAEIARLGGTATHTIVAPGAQGADPHESGHGPISVNEAVVIDIFPRVDATGYHGDLTRTVVKGTAAAAVQQAHAAVDEARQAAIAAAKPGTRAADVHAAAATVLERHGFETDAAARPPHGFFHGTGHGLGLEVHEAPRVSPTSDHVLEAGNIVTIEPGLYYPEWGGVRIEDVVVITEDGCRNLTEADYVLEVG